MSTVPEVLTAVGCGMRVLGLSTVTNVARPDAPQVVSAQEVVEVAATALPKVRSIIRGLVASETCQALSEIAWVAGVKRSATPDCRG
jgi:purine-nucleoside phosphorylase